MNITDEDRNFIRNNIPDAVSLMNGTDVDAILRQIYRFIERKGFAPPHYDEYNTLGRKAQEVYDRIYEANTFPEYQNNIQN